MAHRGWYICQQGEVVQGPFVEAKVIQWLRHGKIQAAMELSVDRETWIPAREGFECDPAASVKPRVAPRPNVAVRRAKPKAGGG